eukprot:gene23845-28871_t
MKPGTPCWSSAELRQSARSQTITLMFTFLDVALSQYKTIEGSLNPRAFKLDVRKIDPIRHYLLGGLTIGAGVALLYLFNGWVGGMSSVFSSSWSFVSKRAFFQQARFVNTRNWRLVYALGVVLGALVWRFTLAGGEAQHTSVPAWQLLVGGFLVGYGARLGNGCTSGHGICGLGSLQLPSLFAVLTFMATAFMTANLMAWSLA